MSEPLPLSPVNYRPMKLEDVGRVHEIDQLSFTLPWPEKSFRYELTENPASLTLVAELFHGFPDPLLIGMAVVWIVVDEAHIATIAIHPDFRGRRYGNSLLAETLRRSYQRGARMATLEVRAGNLVAQKMYHTFGFTIVGRRLHYYRDNNEDAIMMTLRKMDIEYLVSLSRQGYYQ